LASGKFRPRSKGSTRYAKLYADSRTWLQKGWLDYFAPQLYWSIDSREQSFPVLLKWWAAQNKAHRMLLVGLDSTKVAGQTAREGYPARNGQKWKPEEIINQVRLIRKQGAGGHIHWNLRSLMRNEKPGWTAATRPFTAETCIIAGECRGWDRSRPTQAVSGRAGGLNWLQGLGRLANH
jgi:uncharacterized lipoprotein YddW (UPF0748 family)